MTGEPARLLLRHPDGIVDVGAPHREGVLAEPGPDLILEDPTLPPDRLLLRADGGWRVRPELLWSMLDPLDPRTGHEPGDRHDLARRAWRRLAWWRALPGTERAGVTAALDRCARRGGELVALLDRLANAGDPLGADPAAAAGADPAVAPELPVDPAQLAEFLVSETGLGACYGADWSPRSQQADLAAAVARAIGTSQPLLAEAGTGTGKTVAYLAPLLARLASGKHRAVIATYSRALQTQILDGDLPRLIAGRPELGARLLMGRSNYCCLRQRRGYLSRPIEDDRDAARNAAFRCWLQATTDGLRHELVDHPLLGEDVREIFSSVQPCTPACFEQDGCFVVRARRLARDARLVVVNHALLLSDQAAGGALIGPFDDLVVDEAHRLPGVVLDQRSVMLDNLRLTLLEELLGEMRPAGQPLETPALLALRLRDLPEGERAADAAESFGNAVNRCLRAYQSWWRAAGRQFTPGMSASSGQRLRVPDKDVAFAPLTDRTAKLLAAAAEAATAGATLNQRAETVGETSDSVTDLLARCAQAGQLLRQLERDVRFVTADPSDRWVTWVEPSRRGGLRGIGATPLESGPLLRELWYESERAPVATSATLAVGGDFGFMLGELGLTGRRPATGTLAVPSPFAWDEQALCLAPEDMPGPDHPEFADAVAGVLADLRRDVPRQTLALFTSYRLLEQVADTLRRGETADLFAEEPRELLVQSARTGPGELRERFRRGRGSMLLGTSTFWEGVDFPGESLEIVVVTKLPFLVPNDPWVQARCEHLRQAGEDPFRDFMVRDAVLRLRQGVGRLLRRRTDRGVILLLDNRLITRRYGATFLSALPAPVRWLPRRDALSGAVGEFLDRH